ncbi:MULTISPECIES: hypothetical protein [Clostridium]|jgi:hypothetical protein|uniref:Uncharacterized protein n=2 Tax=root TaxID=1 RepID=R9BSH6_9CLOT|nr:MULTISPECIES: hypothetical protein [Clostridium]EOR19957.1 hypothetical protein A500_19404 [Clostridium sartagoforme AAU1]KLE15584.1 hypothetical protein AAT22_10680 [Clostridium sp. C8]
MNNSLKERCKYEVYKLKDELENLVYNMFLDRNKLILEDPEIRKIDNDLGYIALDITGQKDFLVLKEYLKLLYKYKKYLKDIYLKL